MNKNDFITSKLEKIINFFGGDLVSIVLFGSSLNREQFNIVSDLDFIVITKNKVHDQDERSRKYKQSNQADFLLDSFNIYDKNEFKKICSKRGWFVLTVKQNHKVLYDTNDFFRKNLNFYYDKIHKKSVLEKEWYLESPRNIKKLHNYYGTALLSYLESAKLLSDNGKQVEASEMLLNAVHCYCISEILRKGIYITRGEIVQLFIKLSDNIEESVTDSLLKLEQSVNYLYSFDFKNGSEVFVKPDLTDIYKAAYKNFLRILEKK